jgi:hypothetical protein
MKIGNYFKEEIISGKDNSKNYILKNNLQNVYKNKNNF